MLTLLPTFNMHQITETGARSPRRDKAKSLVEHHLPIKETISVQQDSQSYFAFAKCSIKVCAMDTCCSCDMNMKMEESLLVLEKS